VVSLRLDAEKLTLVYDSSQNLDYRASSSGREIHKAYMEWTSQLMKSVHLELSSLCADLTKFQAPEQLGKLFGPLSDENAVIGSPSREFELKTSYGFRTGYVIREYDAFLLGSKSKCGPVSAIFYNDALAELSERDLESSALLAYADLLNHLHAQKKISFSDAEMERMSLKIDIVTPLENVRREELLRFVEWQAQRFDRNETTRKEYDYLLAQKEAEVLERQGAIDQKEQELGLLRRQQQMQVASLDVQRQQLAAQRSMALSQALMNLSQSLSYTPGLRSVSCRSASFGNTTYTNCN
jgi:hypothetical protein